MIIIAVIGFGLAFLFLILVFGQAMGISQVSAKSWGCFAYCAFKINKLWGSILNAPLFGTIPGGFCGC